MQSINTPIYSNKKADKQDLKKKLLYYTRCANLTKIKKLVANGISLDTPLGKNRMTPLHIACLNGESKLVRYLLLHNVDIESQTTDGFTPLHLAVDQDSFTVITILLKNNANPNIKDVYDTTPLQLATEKEHNIRVINAFLDHGAKITNNIIYNPNITYNNQKYLLEKQKRILSKSLAKKIPNKKKLETPEGNKFCPPKKRRKYKQKKANTKYISYFW